MQSQQFCSSASSFQEQNFAYLFLRMCMRTCVHATAEDACVFVSMLCLCVHACMSIRSKGASVCACNCGIRSVYNYVGVCVYVSVCVLM